MTSKAAKLLVMIGLPTVAAAAVVGGGRCRQSARAWAACLRRHRERMHRFLCALNVSLSLSLLRVHRRSELTLMDCLYSFFLTDELKNESTCARPARRALCDVIACVRAQIGTTVRTVASIVTPRSHTSCSARPNCSAST
jgi:hypothetical protein